MSSPVTLRHAEATRAAVRAWGLEVLCLDPRDYSPVLTTVLMPEGHDADRFRQVVLDRYDMSLGTGLAKLKGRVFRIGHLGDFNDLMLMGTLSGVEMGLHDGRRAASAGRRRRRDGRAGRPRHSAATGGQGGLSRLRDAHEVLGCSHA